MKSLRQTALLLSLAFVCGESFAQTEGATGIVQSVRTYGDGKVLVTGFSFSTATCNNGSFTIPGDHPHLSKLLSMVLTAKTTGVPITVVAKTDCSWFPEITPDGTTYVFIGS